MNKIYDPYLDQFIVVYMDDILVYTDREQKHENHLRTTLEVLWDNILFAKFSNCDYWLKEGNYLGYIISKNGMAIDPGKVQTIME